MGESGNGLGNAFGAYDFFAYIIPGALVILPAVFLAQLNPEESPLLSELATAALAVVAAYIVGLAVHAGGARLERSLEKEYPSRHALSRLPETLREKVRTECCRQFDLPLSAPDGLLWDLAQRYLWQTGRNQRVASFMMLHLISRGLIVVALWYAIVIAYQSYVVDPRWLFALPLLAVAAYFFNRVRAAFNRKVAEEVLLMYYVARRAGETSQTT